MKTIKSGSKGAEVKQLQKALNNVKGTGMDFCLVEDGIFGPRTEAAVRAFQRQAELTVDGICGPKTWSRLGFDSQEEVSAKPDINKIIIHCSATREGVKITSDKIDGWHKARNFAYFIDPKSGKKRYIGYHFLVHLDGSIEVCRPENVRGQHVSGQNSGSIGICYIGGLNANGKAKDTRTQAQKDAIRKLLKQLLAKYTKATIHGHREFAAKACPCFDAKEEYKSLVA